MFRGIFKFVLWFIFVFVALRTAYAQDSGNKPADSGGLKEGKWAMTLVSTMDGLSLPGQAGGKTMHYSIKDGKMKGSVSAADGTVELPASNSPELQGIEGQGVLSGQGMNMTMTKCVTKTDGAPDTQLPAGCQSSQRREGNTFYYQVNCKIGESRIEEDGEFTYTGETMQGDIRSRMFINDRTINGNTHITGKYLGPC